MTAKLKRETNYAAVVKQLKTDPNMSVQSAIKIVADETGQTPSNVQGGYYTHKKMLEDTSGSKAESKPITAYDMKLVIYFIEHMGSAAPSELKAYTGLNGRMNAIIQHMARKDIIARENFLIPPPKGAHASFEVSRWKLSDTFIMARDLAKELLT